MRPLSVTTDLTFLSPTLSVPYVPGLAGNYQPPGSLELER